MQQSLRKEFGLDKPILVQYRLYLQGLVTGNLGVSFITRQPVRSNLLEQLGNTIPMVLAGTMLAILLGCTVGVVAAVRRASWWDHAGVATSMFLYSLPAQWVGLMLIVILGGLLPTSGREDFFLSNPTPTQHLIDVGRHMILPALTFALILLGEFALITRSSMLETLGEDYVLTARAKGMGRWKIVRAHALRNAMLPVITLIALNVGYVVGGAILIEIVFSWPGIGLGVRDAVAARDYPMLQGQFLVLAIAVVLCNLVADLVIFQLDPRVRK